ncbi:hypothetical protein L3Q82_009669 [Scortum barcoo]|uniref:Uncharacterized protein n=1 Tax=Scortum barcoo TaxID=214431 RepID=A0ACB8WH56_9TELE|nr:hypothetical protein L3Q82_009669 [Scortum barcoo]
MDEFLVLDVWEKTSTPLQPVETAPGEDHDSSSESSVNSQLSPSMIEDERLALAHLKDITGPLQFAYRTNRNGLKSEKAEEALKDCFNTTLWDVFSDAHGEDIDSLTHCLTDYINFCVENTVPTRTVRSFSNSKPWITPDIKALLKEKRRAFVSGNKEELKSVQRELRRMIRKGKEQLQEEDGAPAAAEQHLWYLIRKAAGPDGISSRLLKSCADQLCGIFGYTFNLSLKLGRVPQLWKTSCIVPVPKTPHPKELNSYRPVALTSHLMKTLERLVLAHLRLLVSSFMDPLQGTVLAPFLFTLYTADFSYNTPSCHLQKFSDDSAVVGLITDGDDREYRGLIQDFADWCLRNNLQINAGKTKELVVDFRRRSHSLDWSDNTNALVKKGNSRLFLLRRLRSFGVQGPLLRTFYDSVVASAIFYRDSLLGQQHHGQGQEENGQTGEEGNPALSWDAPWTQWQVVGNGRMMAKLSSLLNNTSHPLQDSLTALGSSFSERLLHPRCVKERYRRSFLPAAVRLYNKQNAR